MAEVHSARVVVDPELTRGFSRGVATVIQAVVPTLGPTPRTVAVKRPHQGAMPEILDDAATIARRITDLSDRTMDSGAMFVRDLLCRIHDLCGDGAATGAVIFSSLYRGGLRWIEAGGNPDRLRDLLNEASDVILSTLKEQTSALTGTDMLATCIESVCPDSGLTKVLTEALEVSGAWGDIELRNANRTESDCEFVQGFGWSTEAIRTSPTHTGTQQLLEPRVLLTDQRIESERDALRLAWLAATSETPVLILTEGIGDAARIVLSQVPQVYVARIPSLGNPQERFETMHDIALVTGASPRIGVAGHRLDAVELEHLGTARRIWFRDKGFGVIGGVPDPDRFRLAVAELRSQLEQTSDRHRKLRLEQRLRRLNGGTTTVRIGGASELMIKQRMALAERVVKATQQALRTGVLPGAGLALVNCAELFQTSGEDAELRAVHSIVRQALEAPHRTLMMNLGAPGDERSTYVAQIDPTHFENVRDSAHTLLTVVQTSFTAAAQALTIGTLIQRRLSNGGG